MHLTLLVACIISIPKTQSADCYDFWIRWSSCPPMSLFPHSSSTCFKSVDKTFVLLNYEADTSANILCDYRIIDTDLFTCLGINHINAITFDNCFFPKNSVREALKNTNPKVIHIIYNQTQYVDRDLLLARLPDTEKIYIIGARSLQQINISFEDMPFLHTISLYQTDYSFSMSRLSMLPSLKNFAACDGSLGFIPKKFFSESTSLIHINLGNNCLGDLPLGVFSDLHTIYTIRLNHNCLVSVRSEWFEGLNSLLYLDLSYNQLTSIPDNLFSLASNIEVFNISSNLQMTLSEGFLYEAKNLMEFRADNCSLTSVPPNLLKNASRLSIFSISGNNLTHLPLGLFSNQRVLKKILLANNHLITIPKNLFFNLDSLSTLIIHNNEIQSLEYDTFSGLNNLAELDLHANKLEILDSSVFSDLTRLRILDLSRNRLKALSKDSPFGSSRYLKLVNVSHNSLSEFPSINWSLHDSMEVDCDYNIMTMVYLNPIGKNGTKVTLRNNPIVTIKMIHEHTTEKQLIRFLINSSTLICNCNLQGFLTFIGTSIGRQAFLNVTAMKCFAPEKWKNIPVTDVIPIHVVCPLKIDCPTDCHCFKIIKGSILTNCSNARINHPPTLVPFGTSVLYLENNNISSLSDIESLSWNNVSTLYLTNNSLLSLENWTIPSNLQTLAIDKNRLVNLPLILMEKVDVTPEFKIYLAGNDWHCNCHSVSFKKWFTRNKYKIADYNHTLCTRKAREDNKVVKSLIRDTPIDLFCLIHQPIPSSQISAISASVISIALLLICSSVVYYRYNNTIMAFLYSHNLYFHCCEQDIDEDKIFDAFVCYSTADREIAMSMMGELEPSHRLCIHERDWLPGYPISHHIVNSVQSSRKTLLLISKDFLESIWFQVEFRTAYNQMLEDKMHRLVLVIIGKLEDVSHLETDLRHLMSTKTYLQWGEKWFWEKLRYALRGHCPKHANDFSMKEKRSSYNKEGFVQQSNETEITS